MPTPPPRARFPIAVGEAPTSSVRAAGRPVAALGDAAMLADPPEPAIVIEGNPIVRIAGRPATRLDMIAVGTTTGSPGSIPAELTVESVRLGAQKLNLLVIISAAQAKAVSDIAYRAESGEIKPGDVVHSDAQGNPYPGGPYKVHETMVGNPPGYGAAVVEGQDGRIGVGFAGTNFSDPADLQANVDNVSGRPTPQYDQAASDVAAVQSNPAYAGQQIYTAGHSLGGGQAAYASAMNGVPGAGINSSPLGTHYQNQIANAANPDAAAQFRNYVDPRETVHKVPESARQGAEIHKDQTTTSDDEPFYEPWGESLWNQGSQMLLDLLTTWKGIRPIPLGDTAEIAKSKVFGVVCMLTPVQPVPPIKTLSTPFGDIPLHLDGVASHLLTNFDASAPTSCDDAGSNRTVGSIDTR